MIRMEHVSFSYHDQGPSVQDVSFHVAKGEFVAILGANGAGKTTTVRLIDGLIRPLSGKVLIHDADTAVSPVSAAWASETGEGASGAAATSGTPPEAQPSATSWASRPEMASAPAR